MYYLYIKTHNKTGLKYLGKTNAKNPFEYKGSGKHWLRHINKYGYDVTTKILLATESKEEIKETGLFFSKLFNIVKSKEWANLQEEKGDGVSSQFASEENFRRLEKGTHPFCDPEHNKRTNSKRQETKRKNGTHNFKGGKIQREAYKRRVETGEQQKINAKISERVKKEAENGLHPMQRFINVVDINGTVITIPKDDYKKDLTLVHINSLEGKRRLGKDKISEKQRLYREKLKDKEFIKNRIKGSNKRVTCPICGIIGGISSMKRWHFENCKYLKETQK